MFPSLSIRAATVVLLAALGLGGAVAAEEERVMTLSDLGGAETPPPPAPPEESAVVQTPTPAATLPIAVRVDPLIYNEDGSLYTGPMPDGTYCVNGRVAAAAPAPAPRAVTRDPVVIVPDAYDADAGPRAVIVDRPGLFFRFGFLDPDIERYWGDHIRLPGDSRWDLYRYRPERRPPHRPHRFRPRPEGPPRERPEGRRAPRPDRPPRRPRR